ncbi:hypothetical protein [Priestia koreensis]|uniref:hypothetical protein n=1 Tax=Priestia koreensis TaxID=284581 RepID=UPI00345A5FAA
MKKRVVKGIVWIIGFVLFAFSIKLPALGYQNISSTPGTTDYEVTSYSWYGKRISQDVLAGNSEQALNIFQHQTIVQKMEVMILFLLLLTLFYWLFREPRIKILASTISAGILIGVQLIVVHYVFI